jgi:aspartyl-tRNA(Asn)/glutamyl-tRNA(Gln) amidotransferase subunit A
LSHQTISDFRNEIDSGEIDLHDAIRNEIENVKEYNKRLNAFITIFDEDTAFEISKISSKGKKTGLRQFTLYGIPLTVKDNICIAGHRTTAASAAFQNYVPSVNADVVDSLLSLGCVPLGKTNLHELAMGATSSSSFFGPMRNPIDPSRIPGGSSGGSAVSVAMSKLPIVSLGTDTGGSVRIPAALCGVCGFKPTFGIISTSGVLPLGATLDHVGILTKNMQDMQVAFGAITGQSSVLKTPASMFSKSKWKIGVPSEYFFENCTPDVDKAFWWAIEVIRKSGHSVEEDIEIPGVEQINRTRLTIQMAEGAWFYQDLVKDPEKRKLVGKDVMTFFDAGSKTTEMQLLISSRERIALMSGIAGAFQKVDFLAMPTCLTAAPKLDDVLGKEAGSIRRQLVRNTEPFNLCGYPSLSIPSHRLNSSELPTAIQLSGRPFEDRKLLGAGEQVWEFLHSG